MNEIFICAGTEDKKSKAYFSARVTVDDKPGYEIAVSGNKFVFSGRYGSSASGGWQGTYAVGRVARVEMPISVLVNWCINGLLKSDYQVSDTEFKKLMLAIAGSIGTIDTGEGN